MIARILLKTLTLIILTTCLANAQNGFKLSLDYAIDELATDSDGEYTFMITPRYTHQIMEPISISLGVAYINDKSRSSLPFIQSHTVKIDDKLVSKTLSTDHNADQRSYLFQLGFIYKYSNFDLEIFSGIGTSSISNHRNYIERIEEVTSLQQNFIEQYKNAFTWIYGTRISYNYPLTEQLALGLSISASILESSTRDLQGIKGTFTPDERIASELLNDQKSYLDYGESFITTGLQIAYSF